MSNTNAKQVEPRRMMTNKNVLGNVLLYKHPLLIQKMIKRLNISKEDAEILFLDTKRFLYICGTVPGQWVPPPRIDDCWHEFLLFMRDYENFCKQFFGRVLYHEPNNQAEESDNGRTRSTLFAAVDKFGMENLSENWMYSNKKGEFVLGPKSALSVFSYLDAIDPCRTSCGCSAACTGD